MMASACTRLADAKARIRGLEETTRALSHSLQQALMSNRLFTQEQAMLKRYVALYMHQNSVLAASSRDALTRLASAQHENAPTFPNLSRRLEAILSTLIAGALHSQFTQPQLDHARALLYDGIRLMEHSICSFHMQESLSKQAKLNDLTCCICFDRAKNTALVPCAHTVCSLCAQRLEQCPICREDIIEKVSFRI